MKMKKPPIFSTCRRRHRDGYHRLLDRGLLVTAWRIGDVHHRPAAWQCLHPAHGAEMMTSKYLMQSFPVERAEETRQPTCCVKR